MGFYSRAILPKMLDRSMAGQFFIPYRRKVLTEARGVVLEIGFGSGLNLPYYRQEAVRQIVTVEVNPAMHALAQKRIEMCAIPVEPHVLSSEQLPFDGKQFDTVVSTWTMCSIAGIGQALEELRRVLKPNGKLLFIEHGLSPDPKVQKWQRRLNPVYKTLADGCHLDRNFRQLLTEHGFRYQRLEEFYAENAPRIVGYMYQGVASRQ
jgi:ubiquinone/menaquinone biosynthesis C-methylase UbiE